MERFEANGRVLRYGKEATTYGVTYSRTRQERIRINVHHDGAVEVEAPEDATGEAIARAVQKWARWVQEHVAGPRGRFVHVTPRDYVSGEQVIYLGR